MTARLQEICEDILDNIEDAASCVLEAGYAELGEGNDVLRAHLEETLDRIEVALEELGQEDAPHLEPWDESLPEVAALCCVMARDLFDAEGELRESEQELRNQLSALRELIQRRPGGFLDLAQIPNETM